MISVSRPLTPAKTPSSNPCLLLSNTYQVPIDRGARTRLIWSCGKPDAYIQLPVPQPNATAAKPRTTDNQDWPPFILLQSSLSNASSSKGSIVPGGVEQQSNHIFWWVHSSTCNFHCQSTSKVKYHRECCGQEISALKLFRLSKINTITICRGPHKVLLKHKYQSRSGNTGADALYQRTYYQVEDCMAYRDHEAGMYIQGHNIQRKYIINNHLGFWEKQIQGCAHSASSDSQGNQELGPIWAWIPARLCCTTMHSSALVESARVPGMFLCRHLPNASTK